jgi:hypothetical protein
LLHKIPVCINVTFKDFFFARDHQHLPKSLEERKYCQIVSCTVNTQAQRNFEPWFGYGNAMMLSGNLCFGPNFLIESEAIPCLKRQLPVENNFIFGKGSSM